MKVLTVIEDLDLNVKIIKENKEELSPFTNKIRTISLAIKKKKRQ